MRGHSTFTKQCGIKKLATTNTRGDGNSTSTLNPNLHQELARGLKLISSTKWYCQNRKPVILGASNSFVADIDW